MGYRVIVVAAVVAHFAFLAYAIFGGFLAWRWRRAIWPHLLGAGWLLLVIVAQLTCPLTYLEDRARERAGMAAHPDGFIRHYVEGVFYPSGHAVAAQVTVAVIILISWTGGLLVWVRTRPGPADPPR